MEGAALRERGNNSGNARRRRKKPLDLLLVVGDRVCIGIGMLISERKLDTVAFELGAIRNRVHRGSVLVQDINLFEG